MDKLLEFFADGQVFETEENLTIKIVETNNKVEKLSDFLQFSQAEKFVLASPDQTKPKVAVARSFNRAINHNGLDLIKAFEGLYLESYQDPVGIWTIGYGHIQGVKQGMKITISQAEDLLREDLSRYETAVEEAVDITIDDNQFAALTSFCFNLGANSLFKSTLLKLLNQGKIAEAANEFSRWDKAGGQSLLGLSRRRRAERALFLSQSWESFISWKPSTILKFEPGKALLKGEEIRQLQISLAKQGIDINPDGIFGEQTAAAVKQFQQQNNLNVDGIVGAETKKRLGLA